MIHSQSLVNTIFFYLAYNFLSAFLQNFFLCQDHLSGDVPLGYSSRVGSDLGLITDQ